MRTLGVIESKGDTADIERHAAAVMRVWIAEVGGKEWGSWELELALVDVCVVTLGEDVAMESSRHVLVSHNSDLTRRLLQTVSYDTMQCGAHALLWSHENTHFGRLVALKVRNPEHCDAE